jgi:hypothetical protein
VSEELLIELQAELVAARERPQEDAHPAAIQHIAGLARVSESEAAKTLVVIEPQPIVARELLIRRFVEAWLEGQRETYRERQGGS